MSVIYRHLRRKDNREIADLIRMVFREFGIDRPGTVYFDPTTDDLFSLFKDRVQYTGLQKKIMRS